MAGPALTDVPDRYDVVFSLNDGTTYGFLLADSVESNLPFRTHKALYSYSPTFLERQNVSQQYGDNFQDFFLTGSQVDFSEGEGQKFFRVNDVDSVRKYWAGLNVDPTTVPGNVTLTTGVASAASSLGTIATPRSAFMGTDDWFTADSTNLYSVNASLSSASEGAHGCTGVTAITTDYGNVYLSGTSNIRKYVVNTATFSTFSSTANVGAMTFLNNILFGWQFTTDSLLSFDSTGASTSQFQWKNADGSANAVSSTRVRLVPYGGQIYILRTLGEVVELWLYDGSGVEMLAQFPPDFNVDSGSICVASGIVFVSGAYNVGSSFRPAVYYYSNGSLGELWRGSTTSGNAVFPIADFGNGVVFKDPITGNLLQYDLALGGVHCVGNFVRGGSPEPSSSLYTSNIHSAFLLLYSDRIVVFRSSSNYASSGFIETSQYDFDNTLTKVFRGLKVDFDQPANTSVDLAYQLDGAGGSYTSLQTGATSGTEYVLPNNTTGHSISVKVTLNSATGANTPTLKRVYVRAAPTLQQFRRREFLFDISSGTREELGKTSRRTRDLYPYPVDALTGCNNLAKIATQTIPFTVADRFTGSTGMTVLADLQQNQEGYDGFAIYEIRPNVFIGRINLREV